MSCNVKARITIVMMKHFQYSTHNWNQENSGLLTIRPEKIRKITDYKRNMERQKQINTGTKLRYNVEE
jgi:hypothetical protein